MNFSRLVLVKLLHFAVNVFNVGTEISDLQHEFLVDGLLSKRLYGIVMIDRLKNIRLVVTDIDGTLLTSSNALHEGTLVAIGAIRRSKNYHFTVSTGRSFPLTRPFIKLFDLNTPIIFSGGAIYDVSSKNVIAAREITSETVKAIIQFAGERDLGLVAHTPELMLCQMDDAHWTRITEIEWIQGETTDHAIRVRDLAADDHKPIIRLDIFSENYSLSAPDFQVRHMFPQMHAARMTRSIELTPQGVNKGSAIRQLADVMGLDLQQVMAIGDSLNDLPMLEEAGVAVAMGSAPDMVKEAAHIIVPSSDEGGFADALEFLPHFANI